MIWWDLFCVHKFVWCVAKKNRKNKKKETTRIATVTSTQTQSYLIRTSIGLATIAALLEIHTFKNETDTHTYEKQRQRILIIITVFFKKSSFFLAMAQTVEISKRSVFLKCNKIAYVDGQGAGWRDMFLFVCFYSQCLSVSAKQTDEELSIEIIQKIWFATMWKIHWCAASHDCTWNVTNQKRVRRKKKFTHIQTLNFFLMISIQFNHAFEYCV